MRTPRARWEAPVSGAGGAKGAIVVGDRILTTRTVRDASRAQVVLAEGADGGRIWRDVGTIVATEAGDPHDIGDGCLLAPRAAEWWYAYRDNHPSGDAPWFAIRVRTSRDRGRTWENHSTVATSTGARRGLWSPFLARLRNGRIACLHDDEDLPFAAGFPGHQWLAMRVWDEDDKAWRAPSVVSRAHSPRHLSRDGMGSLIDCGGGRLLTVLESVGTDALHASVVRSVRSDDGGATWSWSRRERELVHAADRPRFSAYAPWATAFPGGWIACVFTSNESQADPDAPATPAHRLHGDVLLCWSRDEGKSWSRPEVVHRGGGRNYMPQLLPLGNGRLALLLLDFAADTFVCVPGRLA
ncbi:MAG: sialidase family protein [Armatimonadota bacterium]